MKKGHWVINGDGLLKRTLQSKAQLLFIYFRRLAR